MMPVIHTKRPVTTRQRRRYRATELARHLEHGSAPILTARGHERSISPGMPGTREAARGRPSTWFGWSGDATDLGAADDPPAIATLDAHDSLQWDCKLAAVDAAFAPRIALRRVHA